MLRPLGLNTSGVIYTGKPLSVEELKDLADYPRPLVLMKAVLPPDFPVAKASCHVAGVNNYEGARTAAKFLLQLGHRRIGAILGPLTSRDFADRLEGYRDALREAGVALSDDYIFVGSFDQASGRAGCERLLGLKAPPSALLCSSDPLAFGALDFAKASGVRCPEQLSVIGFDDGPWAMNSYPRLTTMRQPLRELAAWAVNSLVRSATKARTKGHENFIDLPAMLIIRESTAAVPRR